MPLPAQIIRSSRRLAAALLLAGAAVTSAAAQTVSVVPPEGATNTTAQVRADGLPPNADVQILGGPDRNSLSVLGSTRTDARGRASALVKIAAELGNGKPFYLAVKAGDRLVLADPPFRVVSHTGTPPAGAGGMLPLQPADKPQSGQ
jgi:hypothetical protein